MATVCLFCPTKSGVIGVCVAYYLAKKGAPATLIEKSLVACATFGKAGGFLALDWCNGGPIGSQARASFFNPHRALSEELSVPELYGYRSLPALKTTVTKSGCSSPSVDTTIPSWVDLAKVRLEQLGL